MMNSRQIDFFVRKSTMRRRFRRYWKGLCQRIINVYSNCSLPQFVSHLDFVREQYMFMLSKWENILPLPQGWRTTKDRFDYFLIDLIYFDSKEAA